MEISQYSQIHTHIHTHKENINEAITLINGFCYIHNIKQKREREKNCNKLTQKVDDKRNGERWRRQCE